MRRGPRAPMGVLAGTIAVVFVLLMAGGAVGKDVEDITVSEGQTVIKDYGLLAGNEPRDPIFGFSFGQRNPPMCRDPAVTYCDTIDLNIEVPAHYTSADFFRIEIALTWSNPSGVNDLNLYVFRTNGDFFPPWQSQTTSQPEKVALQEPAERKYFIVVSNYQGPNSGYRLNVRFINQGRFSTPEEPNDFGSRSPSEPDSSGDSSDAGLFDLPSPPQPQGADASAGPRPVAKPGADGPSSRRSLIVLAAATLPKGNSNLPFIVASVIATLAAVGLAVFLYLRGRREFGS